MKRITTCFILFILAVYASPKGNDAVNGVISLLETAVKEKDPEKLKECIAPDFSISVATIPSALNYADAIWRRLPDTDSVRIVSRQPEKLPNNGGTKIEVAFYMKGGKTETSAVCLDNNLKIRYIDYYDRLYGIFRDRPAELKAAVPFETDSGSIVITLKLNDSSRPLRFLFDTGADGMAISKHLADSLKLTVHREQNTSVVGADRSVSISADNTVRIGDFSLPGQNIAIFENIGRFDGIIGLNLAKSYIVKIDFDRLSLSLYTMGAYTPAPDETAIDVTVPGGVMMVPCELDLTGKGAIAGNFVFDTGAGFDVVVFSPFVRKNRLLLSGFKYESQSSMVSLGHATHVYHGKATRFAFSGIELNNMPVALQASSGSGGWDLGAAGSIGIRLIEKYNFTIDLVEKKVYLGKREQ